MRIRWAIALIVVGFLVACSGSLFGPPADDDELMAPDDIPLFVLGIAILFVGVYLLPRKTQLREQWDHHSAAGEMIIRSATRLKNRLYAIDVEFDVPGRTIPPGRYEISVGRGKETYVSVGNRIRVTTLDYEGRLRVRAHLQPKSANPRAIDYFEDLKPI
jgi:hypothetical protein